ncbi:EPIDERMAL PATTERNING FACTOR-like protein 1 [Morella rubra]|uniref:Epidermal patterning factor-like protein n=1 Tax=Morella rubra TaxID=262757 RepID=A0A6A1VEE7_9ROSI|nr:EPIDERMAL PATTERNING FACTOR-like protein 1 [Morella rubra]
MAMMNSINSCLLCTTTLVFMVLHILSPASCLKQQQQPPSSPQSLLFGEKSRLGSTPPSCHNKCNQCHPCMAVQVPTMPSSVPVQPGSGRKTQTAPMEFFDSAPRRNKYSNYKPLGWKCRCQNHLFNP